MFENQKDKETAKAIEEESCESEHGSSSDAVPGKKNSASSWHDDSEASAKQEETSSDLAEQVMKEMRRISLQGRQTFGDGVAEGNPFEFM